MQTIFNTHWHPEHTGSNELLGKAGKTIIAHENTRLWLSTDVTWPWNNRRFKRLPKVAQPNKTFYTTGQLSPAVKYGYIPDTAHTDGDLYVHFPNHNVLAVGDVMSGQGWPVVDYVTGGWIGGLVGAHQRLQTLADAQTRIVPARGPVLSLADLKAHASMYSTIYDRLSTMLNKGRGPAEAVEAKPTKEFDATDGERRRVRAPRVRKPVGLLCHQMPSMTTHRRSTVALSLAAPAGAWRCPACSPRRSRRWLEPRGQL